MPADPSPKLFFKLTREQIQHEDHLVNQRLTWLLVVNGFLFTAFAFSLSAEAIAIDKICSKTLQDVTCIDTICREMQIFQLLVPFRLAISFLGIFSALTAIISIKAAHESLDNLIESWVNKRNKENITGFPQISGGNGRNHIKYNGHFSSRYVPAVIFLLWLIVVYKVNTLAFIFIFAITSAIVCKKWKSIF